MLGGYVFLPRLIDKVRLHAKGLLPPEYHPQLLEPDATLDGRFVAFTGLDRETLRAAILAASDDAAVLAWVVAVEPQLLRCFFLLTARLPTQNDRLVAAGVQTLPTEIMALY
jgi:hypothetical protein